MTGRRDRSSSSRTSPVVPVVLVALEAAFVSTWMGAVVHLDRHTRADVPYGLVLLPAIAGLLYAWIVARSRAPLWLRVLGLVVGVPVGVAVFAGLLAQFQAHGSFSAVALHPWTITGPEHDATAVLAFFLTTLAWARGTWLGVRPPTRRRVAGSIVVTGLAFVIFFLVAALHHSPGLDAERDTGALLLLLCFPGALAALSLANERDLEHHSLQGVATRPSLPWVAAIAGPMAAVAALALLVVFAAGPLVPLVGHGLRRAALGVGGAFASLARLLGRLFHATKKVHTTIPKGRPGAGHQAHATSISLPPWVWAVAIGIGALIGLAILAGLAVLLLRAKPFLSRRPKAVEPELADERESLFSWAHLLEQLMAAIRRLFSRRREPVAETTMATAATAPAASSVRGHYRRFLVAARAAGAGRAASETPLELARRVGAATEVRPTFDVLTELYARHRYGDAQDGPDPSALAARCTEELATFFAATVAPDAAPAGSATSRRTRPRS